MKTYSTIDLKNKDCLIIVHYRENSTIKLRFVYNSISNTYMGLMIESFISTVRGFLREVPDFFEVMCDLCDYRKELNGLGFKEVPPTETELLIYQR